MGMLLDLATKAGKALPEERTEPTKVPSVSFVSAPSRYIPEIEAAKDSADTLPDPAAEARRQRVLAMLDAHPEARYALLTDTEADPEAVLLTLAIRDVATVELLIPAEKWDGVLFLDMLERHGGTLH